VGVQPDQGNALGHEKKNLGKAGKKSGNSNGKNQRRKKKVSYLHFEGKLKKSERRSRPRNRGERICGRENQPKQ